MIEGDAAESQRALNEAELAYSTVLKMLKSRRNGLSETPMIQKQPSHSRVDIIYGVSNGF
jgi:hypothetical protein